MKHTLVTGGLGFLGVPLVRSLIAKGDSVRILDNSSRGAPARLGEAARLVEIIEGDIRDPRIVDRAVAGMDRVCHLAYVNGTEYFYKAPAYVLDVAVKGMVNVLDACIRHSVPELLLVSSSEVYQTPPHVPTDESAPLSVPDPRNPRYSYGGGKILCELMALHYGKEHFRRVLIVRPHNVYGPDMGYEHVIPQLTLRLHELLQKNPQQPIAFPIQGDGQQTRSFITVSDFVDGLLLVLEKGEHLEIYHVGTMEEVSIRYLAEEIGRCMGISITIVPGPEAIGGTMRRCPDIRKLSELGFVPKTTLARGLPNTIAWYRKNPPLPRNFSPMPLFLPSL